MRRLLQVSENTPILKRRTSDSGLQWKTVRIDCFHCFYNIAYCIRDKLGNDPSCGLFGVFDGHGGR